MKRRKKDKIVKKQGSMEEAEKRSQQIEWRPNKLTTKLGRNGGKGEKKGEATREKVRRTAQSNENMFALM